MGILSPLILRPSLSKANTKNRTKGKSSLITQRSQCQPHTHPWPVIRARQQSKVTGQKEVAFFLWNPPFFTQCSPIPSQQGFAVQVGDCPSESDPQVLQNFPFHENKTTISQSYSCNASGEAFWFLAPAPHQKKLSGPVMCGHHQPNPKDLTRTNKKV